MLSEIVKKKFLPYGEFMEPYLDYEFYAKLETKVVHTTFFLKDYEIRSFLYVLGKKCKEVSESSFNSIWSSFKTLCKRLLDTPPDHYLSTFLLFLEVENFQDEVEKLVENAFFSKSILLGIKGSYQAGIIIYTKEKISYPQEIKSYVLWLLES